MVEVKTPTENSLEILRNILYHPDFKGTIITTPALCKVLNKSRSYYYKYIGPIMFAQEWLKANEDAPAKAKTYYEKMLKNGICKKNMGEVVRIQQSENSKVRKEEQIFYASSEEIRKTFRTITKTNNHGKQLVATVEKPANENRVEIVQLTEEEKNIESIRDAYVTAQLGDTPNVTKIIQDLNLEAKLDEEKVRQVMATEDWKGQRASHLHRYLDLVPDEVNMMASVRTIETHKMLYQHIRILHRQHMQYYQTGRVTSMDGSVDLKFSPDPSLISTLAEVMRRMVDGTSSVNVFINNGKASPGGSGGGSMSGSAIKSGGDIGDMTIANRKYLSRLSDMSEEELVNELRSFEKLQKLIEAAPNPAEIKT